MPTITTNTNLSTVSNTAGETLIINNGAIVTCNTQIVNRYGAISINDGELILQSGASPFFFPITDGAVIATTSLGKLTVQGNYLQLGISNGTANQVFNSYAGFYLHSIEVETGNGTGIYEQWLNVSPNAITLVGSVGEHGKFFRQDITTTTITFGNDVNGAIPPNGARIRIYSVTLAAVTTGGVLTVGSITSYALRSRVLTSSGGIVNIDKCNLSGVHIDAGFADSCVVSNVSAGSITAASPKSITLSNIGMSRDYTVNTTLLQNLSLSFCTAVLNNISILNGANITFATPAIFTSCNIDLNGIRSTLHTKTGAINALDFTACQIKLQNARLVGGRLNLTATEGSIDNIAYSDRALGVSNQAVSNPQNAISLTNCKNVSISNFSFLPGAALCYSPIVSLSGSRSIDLINFGSPSNPLNLAEHTETIVSIVRFQDSRLKNCFVTNARATAQISSSDNIRIFSSGLDTGYSAALTSSSNTNSQYFGLRAASVPSSFSSSYGSNFYLVFTSATTGQVGVFLNAPDTGYSVISGNPRFVGNGTVNLANGDRFQFTSPEQPYLGCSGFTAITIAGTNTGSLIARYRIITDPYNQPEFTGPWKTFDAANLGAEAISPTNGFRLQYEIEATGTATLNRLSATVSSTALLQDAADYPITFPAILSGHVAGSSLAVFSNTGTRIKSKIGNGTVTPLDIPVPASTLTYSAIARLYGYLSYTTSFATASVGVTVPIVQAVNPFLTSPTAIAALAFTNATQLHRIYDYAIAFLVQIQNIERAVFLTTEDGITLNSAYSIIVDSGVSAIAIDSNTFTVSGLTPGGTFTGISLGSRNITLAQAGDYSGIAVSLSGTTTVVSGNTSLMGWQFGSGATVNLSGGGSAIVTVSGGQIGNITAGPGVTLKIPDQTLRMYGLPNVANAVLFVKDLTTGIINNPTVVAGEATIVTIPARNYQIRADAPGYLASDFVTVSGATPEYQFNLTNYRALYESGTNRLGQISVNPATFAITINDDLPSYTFADVFRTIEDYLATPLGLLLTAHPYPVVLPSKNLLWFPYDAIANQINPAIISPDPTNTSDPEFLFEVYKEGAASPVWDLFDFTGANGRIIRINAEVAIAQVVGGGGLTAQEVANALKLAPLAGSPAAGSVYDRLSTIDSSATAIKAKTDAIALIGGDVRATLDGEAVSVSAIAPNAVNASALASDAIAEIAGAIPNAAQNASAVRTELAVELGQIDATISSRATPSDVTVSGGFTGSDRTELQGKLNATSYTAPPSTTAIATAVDAALAGDFAALVTLLGLQDDAIASIITLAERIEQGTFGRYQISNGVLTFYGTDNTTVLASYQLRKGGAIVDTTGVEIDERRVV